MQVIQDLKRVKIDKSWSFSDKTRKETSYITHNYHRYPAKFIPQIVSRLIEKYTKEKDLVLDPFGGCGTTLVEAKVMGRKSFGTDINPVAVLITKAKKTPINPTNLEKQFAILLEAIDSFSDETEVSELKHERIDYWFKADEKRKLSFLFSKISKIKNQDERDFFYCGFSNILKNCSIWLQKSNKPTRDLNKIPSNPFVIFPKQIKQMMKRNFEFFKLLKTSSNVEMQSEIDCSDARKIKLNSRSVDLIVTSPPYVTSYEYADLHQLSALWFEYTKDLSDFRKRFIGTAYSEVKEENLNSKTAESIKTELLEKGERKKAEEVSRYFGEMNEVFKEMKRVLKKKGKASIVIGNTKLKGVEILSAEVFIEQFKNFGFKIEDIIKREIPSKNLPSTRDKITGRFAKTDSKNKTFAYPTEYILIFEKI